MQLNKAAISQGTVTHFKWPSNWRALNNRGSYLSRWWRWNWILPALTWIEFIHQTCGDLGQLLIWLATQSEVSSQWAGPNEYLLCGHNYSITDLELWHSLSDLFNLQDAVWLALVLSHDCVRLAARGATGSSSGLWMFAELRRVVCNQSWATFFIKRRWRAHSRTINRRCLW